MRSKCCNETVSRPAAGKGKWSCDSCHKVVRHAPLTIQSGDVGASLIVIAVTGMLPGTSGDFQREDPNTPDLFAASILVVKESETEWTTYYGRSWSADDRSWHDAVEMAHYIQRTIL